MTRSLVAATLIAISALALPSSAIAELPVVAGDAGQVTQLADGSVRHNGSGFVFPTALAEMPARKIAVYGASDVSVDYTLFGGGNGDAWISLYVYPASHSLNDEAAQIEHDLVERWHAKSIDSPVALPSAAADARAGWFAGAIPEMTATNGYIVVQRGKWFLMTRITIPSQGGKDALARTAAALNAVAWAWQPMTGDAA